MKVLVSTAYWPNLHYFYYMLNSEETTIEWHDHYQKQSFRNRTLILSANGPLALTIPLRHSGNRNEMPICYRENWQKNHFRAIESAYNCSPFYEYFKDEIKKFYERKDFDSLREYNHQQLLCILSILKISVNLTKTPAYGIASGATDLREVIHPKKTISNDDPAMAILQKPYYQTFGDKFAFQPNLSILDLIFNTGLHAREYLSA